MDYEDGDYGEFYRASIGGEISTSEYSFAANYYLPITDDKRGGGKVAFSQKGYDANLRICLAADYYHYDGEYGVEDDKGLRYGLEVQPINDLRIGVFYDDGGEKFGGDIAFITLAIGSYRNSRNQLPIFRPIYFRRFCGNIRKGLYQLRLCKL